MAHTVYFRVDASVDIGTGHIVRCQTLAKRLQRHGVECRFVCRQLEGNMIDRVQCNGFDVLVLNQSEDDVLMPVESSNSSPPHASWLGTDWATDATQTIDALRDVKPDWLIVDHYALDARWETHLRPHTAKIMVIDDLADRQHDCDVLLDQNLAADMDSRYQGLVPPHCTLLLGPHYALLQPEYGKLRPRTPPRMDVQRVLIFFGGVDWHNMTGVAVAAFNELQRDDIAVDVVLSARSPHAASVRRLIQGRDNITLHDSVPSLAPLMVAADVAVGASGVTSWERCCLGLPSLVVTVADNQKQIAAELDRQRLARWLGDFNQVTLASLKDALRAIIDAPDIAPWSRLCASVLDGQGTHRVASILTMTAKTSLHCRPAQVDDETLLLRWANDPVVRAQSFTSSLITADKHRRWFYGRLRRLQQCHMYVAESEHGLPVGQVRFECTPDGWEIGYSVDKIARGLGFGTKVLRSAVDQLSRVIKSGTVIGRVKFDNRPSLAVFERLGFARSDESDHVVFRLQINND